MSRAARALLAARREPVRLVIYDCDGVLVDSEPIANRVVAAEITALGWPISAAECDRLFLGMSYHDTARVVSERIGRPLPGLWLERLLERVVAVLAREAVLVPGAREALDATDAMGMAWCVASNSSMGEMAAKFQCTGLEARMQGRLHSGHDIVVRGGRGKPAPDLFLAAAASAGIEPAHCLVIEDSVPGTTAARAAGMTCLGLARHGQDALLAGLGAAPFGTMHDLPDLLRLARGGHA